MQLKLKKRSPNAALGPIRRRGDIPSILYAKGKKTQSMITNGVDFSTALRHVDKGALAVTVFDVNIEDGTSLKAIVKAIDYHPVTYKVLHLDLMELQEAVPVSIKVPIRFASVLDCVGVKQGGVLRRVIHCLKVDCLPKDMPKEFVLDVGSLGMKQSKRLSDIKFPTGVSSKANLEEVAVTVAKR